MRAFNIDWETDGYSVELPNSVIIPCEVEEIDIADYLSDKYGYLVNSFEVSITFDEMTRGDLAKLRGEIVLNSLYITDYENSFGFSANSVAEFFDGYVSFLNELAEEDDFHTDDDFEFFDKYDNTENLYSWYCCFDDFDWVEYEEEKQDDIRISWCGIPIY